MIVIAGVMSTSEWYGWTAIVYTFTAMALALAISGVRFRILLR
jgi:hypothetical protein